MLTDTTIKKAKAKDKDYKLSDEKGLYALVTKAGAKYWRLKFRFGGKEKVLALGVYPETSLKDARVNRDKAREQIRLGNDPSTIRKIEKISKTEAGANSFKAIATEWYQVKMKDKSYSYQTRSMRALEKN